MTQVQKIDKSGLFEPLAKMREPFPANQVSKLPKESKAQAEARKANRDLIVWKCDICGGMHHKNAVHLDYVGHAALTDRLLDTDITWSWEPVAADEHGLPLFDRVGGLWIKLTVGGVTRLGYGTADGKSGGDAVKEIIGDALRNAAMRFGAALDLWHKGDLHADEPEDVRPERDGPEPRSKLDGPHTSKTALKKAVHDMIGAVKKTATAEEIDNILRDGKATIAQATRDWPVLINGDPEMPENIGLKGFVAEQRMTLERCLSSIWINRMREECTTTKELAEWHVKNGEMLDEMGDENRARFDNAYEAYDSALTAAEMTMAG